MLRDSGSPREPKRAQCLCAGCIKGVPWPALLQRHHDSTSGGLSVKSSEALWRASKDSHEQHGQRAPDAVPCLPGTSPVSQRGVLSAKLAAQASPGDSRDVEQPAAPC